MHELSLAIEILKNVLDQAEANDANKVNEVYLELMSPLADSNINSENLQSYFDLVSKGTIAEGAELSIEFDNDGDSPVQINDLDFGLTSISDAYSSENDDVGLQDSYGMMLKGLRIEKN